MKYLNNLSQLLIFGLHGVTPSRYIIDHDSCTCNLLLNFQVKSEHHHLELQEAPWLYLRSRSAGKGAGVYLLILILSLITASFISGDVMCLHQLENHEPVEFGELGIDPVERDQVHLIPKIFQALTYVKI